MSDSKPAMNTADGGPDSKPDPEGAGGDGGASSEQVNIKVRDSEGNEVQFRIKKKTQLKKLMDAYCGRMGTSVGTYRFLFDGNRINDTDTPESLEMEDMDVIDAVLFQQGGIECSPLFLFAPVSCRC
ncbi:hypothetical protein BU14_0251s0009 [Porphyra umbilicalis]|uniref:Ubiquitin-like domain-containing protein n=1 Tax=Porphyra umbilicalis TaxID=2786 RepID=A0A1X6P2Q8_PORUM|nr:hypothetical protein BU14_0251s0009 [Porphyra umbilicalis]|eukprot:OSX75169.1 hypothetical protein BU14_0251s0009 [Porphyra umbilicalis]